MHNLRAYYSSTINDFLCQPEAEVLGIIHSNDSSAETTIQQSNAWKMEVEILKEQLHGLDGRVIFEYTIPRMGKRVDVVVLHQNIVFLLEFKCGDTEYRTNTYDQLYDYALDLRNFQKESHDKLLVPIMVSTGAPEVIIEIRERITSSSHCPAMREISGKSSVWSAACMPSHNLITLHGRIRSIFRHLQ